MRRNGGRKSGKSVLSVQFDDDDKVVIIIFFFFTYDEFCEYLRLICSFNYTRMLRAILNKSWRQHSTKHQLYGHLPPITKTIQVTRTRYAGHYWKSRDELISDVLLWTPTYGRAKAGRPARTYMQQLCEDTGCSPEDLPEAMNDREKWRDPDPLTNFTFSWRKKTVRRKTITLKHLNLQ